MPNSVNDTIYIPPEWSYKNKREFTTDLDQNAFLRLLIEQLKQQDPLSPMDNQQFIQQTTIMAIAERLTRIQTLIEESNNSLLTLPQYEALIGKTATYERVTVDEWTGETTREIKTDTINDVKIVDGKIMFIIGNDVVPRSNVIGLESDGIANENLLDNAFRLTQLIGAVVTYTEQETGDNGPIDVSKSGTIIGFTLKDGQIVVTLDNGKKLPMSEISGLEVAPDSMPMDHALQYAQLVGWKVTYLEEVVGDDGSKETVEKTGTVDAVSMKNGLIELLLTDGTKVSLRDVIGFEA